MFIRRIPPLPLMATVGVVLFVSAPTASAITTSHSSRLGCGALVTTDVTLDHDLIGCPGDGLVVAADGVTVNLNGHTITGDGIPGTVRFDDGVHIEGRRDVRVFGGTLSGFERGIGLISSQDSTISRLRLVANQRVGISVRATSHSVVSEILAQGNTFVGIFVAQGSTDNRIERNTTSDSEQGITLEYVDNNLIKGNRLSRTSGQIIIAGNGNRIVDNTITDAVTCGPDCGGYGISFEAGSNNIISGNRVTNTTYDGIRVSAYDPGLATVGNVVRDNVVRNAGLDGIAVATTGDAATPPPSGTLVTGNTVIGSAGDGIHVAESGTLIGSNLVIRNGRYGIEAVPGVIDGGHNRARANGLTPPCLGVTCR